MRQIRLTFFHITRLAFFPRYRPISASRVYVWIRALPRLGLAAPELPLVAQLWQQALAESRLHRLRLQQRLRVPGQ